MLDDYDDDDENLPDEGLARLDIYSEDMSAEELAFFIGQPADDLWNRGLPWRGKGPSKTTGISYEEETPPTDTPEQQLAKLLERIVPFSDRLADLAQRPGIKMWLVVVYFATRGSALRRRRDPQLRFDAETLATIAKLGVTLKIEVYDN